MKAGARTVNMTFSARTPGITAVGGKTFTDAVKSTCQHPKRAVIFLYNHVLIKAPVGNVGVSPERKRAAVI